MNSGDDCTHVCTCRCCERCTSAAHERGQVRHDDCGRVTRCSTHQHIPPCIPTHAIIHSSYVCMYTYIHASYVCVCGVCRYQYIFLSGGATRSVYINDETRAEIAGVRALTNGILCVAPAAHFASDTYAQFAQQFKRVQSSVPELAVVDRTQIPGIWCEHTTYSHMHHTCSRVARCCCLYRAATGYDSLYLIAYALHELIHIQHADPHVDRALFLSILKNVTFNGSTGVVQLDTHTGDRQQAIIEIQNFVNGSIIPVGTSTCTYTVRVIQSAYTFLTREWRCCCWYIRHNK